MWKIKPYKKWQNLLEGFVWPIGTGRLMGDPMFRVTPCSFRLDPMLVFGAAYGVNAI